MYQVVGISSSVSRILVGSAMVTSGGEAKTVARPGWSCCRDMVALGSASLAARVVRRWPEGHGGTRVGFV